MTDETRNDHAQNEDELNFQTFQKETLQRLKRDLKKAAALLTDGEARFLVDAYYRQQDERIRTDAQARAMLQGKDDVSGADTLIHFFSEQHAALEAQMKNALGEYAMSRTAGKWAMSIHGIGPVISAGLLANIDIHRAPYAGHIWSFAGLTNQQWLGTEKAKALVKSLMAVSEQPDDLAYLAAAKLGRNADNLIALATQPLKGKDEKQPLTVSTLTAALARRPWNASFKMLCAYKIGESFVKFQGSEKDFYGKVFAQRKAAYIVANMKGEFDAAAKQILTEKSFSESTDAWQFLSGCYPATVFETFYTLKAEQRPALLKKLRSEPGTYPGMLPPAQIHARARRVAVKLFLSHYWQVLYESTFNKPAPKPWIIDHGGHENWFPAPNWSLES